MVTSSDVTCRAAYEGDIGLIAITREMSFDVRREGVSGRIDTHTFSVGENGDLTGYCFNGCSSNNYQAALIPPVARSLYQEVQGRIPSVDVIRGCELSGIYRYVQQVTAGRGANMVHADLVNISGTEEQGFQAVLPNGDFVQATPTMLSFTPRDTDVFPIVSIPLETNQPDTSFVTAFYTLLRDAKLRAVQEQVKLQPTS